jgi:hypothetical protein
MKQRFFLMSLAAITLLCSTAVEAYNHNGRHYNRPNYRKQYQQTQPPRDYYPLKPQYQHSPVHENVTTGVLGSVLGYEIAKDDTVAIGLGATNGSYLRNSALKKR